MATALNSLPDFFKVFQEIVFSTDEQTRPLKRKSTLFKREKELTDSLTALRASKDWIGLGVMLEVIRQFELNLPVSFFKEAPSIEVCKGLEQNQDKIAETLVQITFARAEKLFNNARSGQKVKKYLDRHRFVEYAIRLVQGLFQADDFWPYASPTSEEVCRFIAQCYLLRSRLALPKGSDVPGKKIEAIGKARKWAEKAGPQTNELKAEIALEQARWDKSYTNEELSSVLKEFLSGTGLDIQNSVYRAAYDMARQIGLSGIADQDAGLCSLSGDNSDPWLPLLQARAAYRRRTNDLPDRLSAAAGALKGVPLSFPLWDETVDLLTTIKKQGQSGWEGPAIEAWKTCRQEEARIKLSVQIRWYWSRQAALYDLAFMAAKRKGGSNGAIQAAQVADSLKSRPAIKLTQAEKSLSGENDRMVLDKLMDIETSFATGSFQSGLDAVVPAGSGTSLKEPDPTKVDKQWSVVHFYISQDHAGHAVIFNGHDPCPNIVGFKLTDTWKAYRDWKTALHQDSGRSLEETNPSLRTLCEACGEMIDPVIDAVKADNIMFVPHGFLHLTPLHAALRKNGPLFIDKTCLFLPAWGLQTQPADIKRTHGAVMLTNWSAAKDLKAFIDDPIWTNLKKNQCTPEYCIREINSCNSESWQAAVFYCHGQANYLNPYQSALKMHNGLLTHQDIVRKATNCLEGTQVILTACESDLVYDSASQTDEHLSLAAAFLQKKASYVCGTLFKCKPDISSEIIIALAKNPGTPLYKTVREIQCENYNRPEDLYKVASYRVMGGIGQIGPTGPCQKQGD